MAGFGGAGGLLPLLTGIAEGEQLRRKEEERLRQQALIEQLRSVQLQAAQQDLGFGRNRETRAAAAEARAVAAEGRAAAAAERAQTDFENREARAVAAEGRAAGADERARTDFENRQEDRATLQSGHKATADRLVSEFPELFPTPADALVAARGGTTPESVRRDRLNDRRTRAALDSTYAANDARVEKMRLDEMFAEVIGRPAAAEMLVDETKDPELIAPYLGVLVGKDITPGDVVQLRLRLAELVARQGRAGQNTLDTFVDQALESAFGGGSAQDTTPTRPRR